MKEYSRKYPEFSLCGLNCVLCPRFQTEGVSRSPGCGGKNFKEKHPTCAVITCSLKHNNIEFCYDCEEFPCKKYDVPTMQDSFISKKNFLENMSEAKDNFKLYMKGLKEKQSVLEELLKNYNDGRSKNYYCIAVNLIPLKDLESIMVKIQKIKNENIPIKEKAKKAKNIFEEESEILDIKIKLRK